ncbi:IS110 family transposase [Candidatus Poriferisodalis sp.]|uniref:IS110 family transposase n=1 Tax=Candidatus Poriferisodalis sp. TaxID=3101277 RepID=UPI003B5B84B9
MASIAPEPERRGIIVGVDTHKHTHAAVAVDELGSRLGECHVRANRDGYAQLEAWAVSLGRPTAFGVEGTGSYGVGLASWLRRSGYRLVEVNRGDRRSRRTNGRTDTLDAEAAARSVLSGQATAVPKSADGTVEMIRQVKIARDTARKGRTSAIVTLKAVIVTVPAELREQLEGLTDKALIGRCAGLRPGPIVTPVASAKHALRSLARRWTALDAEIADHDRILDELTSAHSPSLRDGFGIGADTAAEMLIVFGDNPERIRSEAAFAKLCGACPIPASSGITNRHRLSRAGHRHANAALYRAVIVRMRFHQPTIDYTHRRTKEGLSKRDIIRCLKRFLAREIYRRVMTDHRARSDQQHPNQTNS